MSELKTKVVFQLDRDGYYVGETLADESPLEPGVWHIPGGCVELAPPAIPPNKVARFLGGRWAVVDVPQHEPAPAPPLLVAEEHEYFPPIQHESLEETEH